MTDEGAERIGGISIDATISDEGVDAQLAALLEKMRAAADQMSAALTVEPTVRQGQAAQANPQQARRQQQRAQPVPVSYGPGAATRAQAQQGQTSQVRAINAELAKTGEFYNTQTGEIEKLTAKLGKEREAFTHVREASRAQQTEFVQGARVAGDVPPLAINIDTAAAKDQLDAFLTEFKTSMAMAQKAAIIHVEVERPPTPVTPTAAKQTVEKAVVAAETEAPAPVRRARQAQAAAQPFAAFATDEVPLTATGGGRRRKNIDRTQGEEEEAPRIRYNRHGAPVLDIAPGEDLGSTSVSRTRRGLNRYGVQPIHLIGDTSLGQSVRVQRATETEARRRGRAPETAEQRHLTELSYLAQHDQRDEPQGGGFAPHRTPQEVAEVRRQATAQPVPRDEAQAAANRRARSADLAAGTRRQQSEHRTDEGSDTTGTTETGRGVRTAAGRRGPAVRKTEADVERREAERIAGSEAQTFTAGRTLRTFESSLGGFFAGGRARVEAQAALAAANEKVRISQDRLREPEVIRSRRATAQATEELTTAENERAKALERVQSFSGPTAAIRTFAGIGVATIAFSLALKGVGVALDAIGPALGDVVDTMGGFASKSTAVTSALAQQTAAQKGNVAAVIAGQAATAGLSADASTYLSTQLKLTTQVKAGALAQQQASDLFRAGTGTNQQVPQGLFGGFGGVGGSSFLGQQLGGGKGFSEQVLGDVSAIRRPQSQGPDLLGNLEKGLSFITNPDVHDTVTSAAKDQGNPLFDFLGGVGRGTPLPYINDAIGGIGDQLFRGGQAPPPEKTQAQAATEAPTPELTAYLNDLNKAASRGAQSLGQVVNATYQVTTNSDEMAKAMAAAAQDGDTFGVSLARLGVILADTNGKAVGAANQRQAETQAAVGRGIPDIGTLSQVATANEAQREREAQASIPALQQQFQYERPAFLAGTQRQQQFAQFAQLPAQQALSNLAQPLLAPGTGLTGRTKIGGATLPVAASGGEQARVNAGLKGANDLQSQLNAKYKEGRSVLEDTYKPELVRDFGQAAGDAFQTAVDKVTATGKQIAGLQSGIVNEQAAYQVAQYNYQLLIARRSLSDIGGLTGKNFGAGESYLGGLEKQNLALSRQGQLLQFNLSQRQINYQTAVAGFQAPGVTPEERQANVKEAKLEASFAQKQLNIQKQTFGNQVQIVDTENLRQGADLAKQIGLLTQGRQVTIDVKVKTAELERAQQLQAQQVADVGTYITAVDSVINHDFAQITALETAAGKAMFGASAYAASAFNKYLTSTIAALDKYAASFTMPTINAQGGVGTQPYGPSTGATGSRDTSLRSLPPGHAAGFLGSTTGASTMTVGEAGSETVAILRNPRAADWGGFGGGGGGPVTINFGDVTVRSTADIDEITRRVTTALGRQAALKGGRTVN